MRNSRDAYYNARADFSAFLNYIRAHNINATPPHQHAGYCSVVNAVDCGAGRFDFAADHAEQFQAFVCEAFGADGETTIDLVAWPLNNPFHVLSMFGKCGLLGAWEAMNPATYYMGTPLIMHRSPLDWLKAGCRGAAVVTPYVAARMFIDIPGKLAAQNYQHGRELQSLTEIVVPKNRFVVPVEAGRVAR